MPGSQDGCTQGWGLLCTKYVDICTPNPLSRYDGHYLQYLYTVGATTGILSPFSSAPFFMMPPPLTWGVGRHNAGEPLSLHVSLQSTDAGKCLALHVMKAKNKLHVD